MGACVKLKKYKPPFFFVAVRLVKKKSLGLFCANLAPLLFCSARLSCAQNKIKPLNGQAGKKKASDGAGLRGAHSHHSHTHALTAQAADLCMPPLEAVAGPQSILALLMETSCESARPKRKREEAEPKQEARRPAAHASDLDQNWDGPAFHGGPGFENGSFRFRGRANRAILDGWKDEENEEATEVFFLSC